MRTVEVLIAIGILVGGVAGLTAYTNIPAPQSIYSTQLQNLGYSALSHAESSGVLQAAAFNPSGSSMAQLQQSLLAVLPGDVVYNLTVYQVAGAQGSTGLTTYTPVASSSDYVGNGPKFTVSVSYVVAPLNLSYVLSARPYKANLFILNTSDAEGWWTTGYTGAVLASSLKSLLTERAYFNATITINNTREMYELFSAGKIAVRGGINSYGLQGGIVINVFGEAVPIPSEFFINHNNNNVCPGFSTELYCYDYWLGGEVSMYNVTWVSVVGWPFYEVSNTNSAFDAMQFNGSACPYGYPYFGVYGICGQGPSGLNAFAAGLGGVQDGTCSLSPGGTLPGQLSSQVKAAENAYGIYVNPTQTSTRAMPPGEFENCKLNPTLSLITASGTGYDPAEVYTHQCSSGSGVCGSFIDIGLVRIPDIRTTALALFAYFQPAVAPNANYLATGYTRLVVLQLGEV